MIIRPHLNFGSLHRAWQLPGGFILEVWPGSLSPLPDCPPLCGHNGADWIAGGWGRLTAIWNTHVLAPSQLRSVCSPLKVSLDDEPSDKAWPRILTTGKRHEPDFFFPPPPLKWFGWCDRSPLIAEISPGAERGLQWRRRTFFFFFFGFAVTLAIRWPSCEKSDLRCPCSFYPYFCLLPPPPRDFVPK